MKRISIGSTKVGTGCPVFIIAEAGVNHNGRLDLALKLIDVAADARADAVKFQTFKASDVVTDSGIMAEYQVRNSGRRESQRAMLEKLELNEMHYPAIIRRCLERNITFLSTPHGGIPSVDFLETFKHPAYKISSPDLTNRPLIERVAKTRKPILLSTGMGTLKEVIDATRWIKKVGNNQVVILHCTSNYPAQPDEVNLRAMQTLMHTFDFPVGYSDHTEGAQASLMAVTLGACLIEKHFTLSKKMEGPDHAASLEPHELADLISSVRDVERFLGSAEKKPTKSEIKMRPVIRKSIVTARAVKRGEKITLDMLRFKRPGTGISPSGYKDVVGKKARRDMPVDHMLTSSDYGA